MEISEQTPEDNEDPLSLAVPGYDLPGPLSPPSSLAWIFVFILNALKVFRS